MVAKLANAPFALIGISSDGSRDALINDMDKHGVQWRQVWDCAGSTGHVGKWGQAWNVRGPGNFFVLDHEGVIRHRFDNHHVKKGLLDEAVDALVENATKKQ